MNSATGKYDFVKIVKVWPSLTSRLQGHEERTMYDLFIIFYQRPQTFFGLITMLLIYICIKHKKDSTSHLIKKKKKKERHLL